MIDRLEEGQSEFQKENNYVLENGEVLETKPEVDLPSLFEHTSGKILDTMVKYDIVLATGPSGIGKTELFLGRLDRQIKAGGITDALAEKSTPYFYQDLQNKSNYLRWIYADTGSTPDLPKDKVDSVKKSKVILIDEGLIMHRMTDIPEIIGKMVGEGKKVIIVGGGRGSTEEQFSEMEKHLSVAGLELDSENQKIAIKPTLLTVKQSQDLLVKRGRGMTDILAERIVNRYEELQIPLMFRAVWFAPFPLTNREQPVEEVLELIDRRTLYHSQIRHVVDPQRNR